MATVHHWSPRMVADIVAFDSDDNPVLIAEVKADRLSEESAGEILRSLIEGAKLPRENLAAAFHRNIDEAIRGAVAPEVLDQVSRALASGVSKAVDEVMGLAETQPLYVMLVDLGAIRIARSDDPATTLTLDSEQILSRYDPDFGKKRIFARYLKALVESWIRDIAYRWKHELPPDLEELTLIGLTDRLKDGTTSREVELDRDALP